MQKKLGILLTNTGTPNDCTTQAVRAYLREFLSDKRVVKIPHFIWLPILYGLILPFRSKRSAKLYQKIWTAKGAPMRVYMQALATALESDLHMPVAIGMNYGTPSIETGLKKLLQQGMEELVILPLFPQYSNTTTASTFDKVVAVLKTLTSLPTAKFISHYFDHPAYIQALANSAKTFFGETMPEQLLISFHGIPKSFAKNDPYPLQCEKTAELLAQNLNLKKEQWTLCYQSQFGYDEWLKPSTQDLFESLPKQNIKNIGVICPGFSVDCLETLEEIEIRGKALFLAHGGQSLRYVPALNTSMEQIALIKAIRDPIASVQKWDEDFAFKRSLIYNTDQNHNKLD